jgi:hypothetical protein
VVAGVKIKDLIVCMKETGMYRGLTFPSTMFTQNTSGIGNILLHRSADATSTSGFVFSTLIATYSTLQRSEGP